MKEKGRHIVRPSAEPTTIDRPQLSAEGPTINETRIIGIELAVRPNGTSEVELFMAGMTHTIPNGPWMHNEARVTIHTSNGDITMTCPLRPGQYGSYR